MTMIDQDRAAGPQDDLSTGAFVEVHNRFDGAWNGGFVLEELVAAEGGCRIRRISDGAVFPAVLPLSRVRPRR